MTRVEGEGEGRICKEKRGRIDWITHIIRQSGNGSLSLNQQYRVKYSLLQTRK
jgi:hypothetical protein